jgi:hypothetical protein
MESAHEDEAIKTTVSEQLRKALDEIGGEPLKGSGFEDEARRRSRADNNDAEAARLLRARNEITCAVYFAGLGWMV